MFDGYEQKKFKFDFFVSEKNIQNAPKPKTCSNAAKKCLVEYSLITRLCSLPRINLPENDSWQDLRRPPDSRELEGIQDEFS